MMQKAELQMEHILEKIRQAKKKGLKKLDLSGDWAVSPSAKKLTQIPPEIYDLEQLKYLDLKWNVLTDLPDEISRLQELAGLNLSGNRFKTFPEAVLCLKNLKTLVLSRNQLSQIPDSISRLQSLTRLYLSYNALTEIPDSIGNLENLTELYISCNKITRIPPSITRLKRLEKLDLNYNPIENPPIEIWSKGVKAIRDYFRQLETQGTDYLHEAKFLIVGEAGAGKTTLAKKIEYPGYELRSDEPSTHGIDVIRWQTDIDGRTFRVNIWDFGGQEIYHATHQFFLTKRSLYALVADTRKDDTDFYYWLNIVELLSDNSPLLIIKNEKQNRHRDINERQLRARFANFKETLSANFADNRGMPEILKTIKRYISALPHVGAALPKTWVNVREALETDSRNHISLEQYLNLCGKYGFEHRKDKLQLSGYLHDLGVCLHFQADPLLKKTVILKPKWGTDAVYKVLDNREVIRNLGKFDRQDLAKIWHEDRYSDMIDELLQLMINFRLCYEIPDSKNVYIAPQLLSENQPAYRWPEKNNLMLRYTFEFMPKGIMSRFIAAMHRLIAKQKFVWKSGVILEKNSAKAEVIGHYHQREIRIRVAGRHKKDLMTIIVYELDKICNSFHRIVSGKWIPCNCAACKNNPKPHFYSYRILRKFKNDAQPLIQCQKSYLMTDVCTLIEDIFIQPDDKKEKKMPDQAKVIKILFLAANPSDTARLRLDTEMREIEYTLRQSEFRDRFEIEQHWATRISDLQTCLLRHKPDIVHFSGHGEASGELFFEDNSGKKHPVSSRALSQLFSILKDNIRCVLLNACYSQKQAQGIAAHIDCVIGMSDKIADASAIGFAAAFYQALGFGRSMKEAFDLGCVQIDLANLNQQDIPKLLCRKDVDSASVYL